MRFVPMVALVLVAVDPSSIVLAQRSRQTPATASSKAINIVDVVGCLTEGTANTWVLTNASDPEVSTKPGATAEEIKAAETKPLGKQRYGLIGLGLFEPASHKGHKMAVKGLLIQDGKNTRINVTSFQMAGATCVK